MARRNDRRSFAAVLLLVFGVAGFAVAGAWRDPAVKPLTTPPDIDARFRLRLTEPPLPHDQRISWRDGTLRAWLDATPGLSRNLRGRLETGGLRLAVRPWIHTTRWLAQPVEPVADDGSFALRLMFDHRWTEPMILRLELEDTSTGEIVARYSYYLAERRR